MDSVQRVVAVETSQPPDVKALIVFDLAPDPHKVIHEVNSPEYNRYSVLNYRFTTSLNIKNDMISFN